MSWGVVAFLGASTLLLLLAIRKLLAALKIAWKEELREGQREREKE